MKPLNLFLAFSVILFFASCSKQIACQQKTVDVLVIGGTTSGTSAGIASAREGVSTLIVEESPWLGGMFSAQGVGACDGNHNLHSGIWNEFRDRIRTHYGGAQAVQTGWVSNTLFEPHVADSIFKSMADAEQSLQLIYGYHLAEVLKNNNVVTGAIFENEKGDKIRVNAKITIDATDIGESLKMAGADYRLGMDSKKETGEANAPDEANDIVQDLTWVAILKDFGPDADKTIPKPNGYRKEDFEKSCNETADNRKIDCDQMLTYGKMPNGKYMINWPKYGNDVYLNVIELSREDRIRELQKAKQATLQFVYHIQHELGYKNLGLADDEYDTSDLLAYMPYHREGRRVRGLAFLTYNHVAEPYAQKEPLYRTGISVGDYPVDHHHKKNPNAPDVGFPPVPSFNVPLGSLIPTKIDGLIVSDKSISVSNLINGSTRLQPVVLLTGQAAGVLAAVSVKESKQPRNVSVRAIQRKLLENKAYIMPLFDVSPTDVDFEAIQRVTATGILKTTGEAYQWANRTWFYPDSTISVKEFTVGLNSFNNIVELSSSTDLLTDTEAIKLLSQAAGKDFSTANTSHKPVTRRRLAQLIDSLLNPFEKEIDFNGYLKK